MLSGHKATPLSDAEQADQNKNFEGYKGGLVRLSPGNWIVMKSLLPIADRIYDFKLKPTDVMIVTFAKCGTTWMQEIIWTMRNNPDLNNPMASMGVNMRCPFLEFDQLVPPEAVQQMGPNSDLMKGFAMMCPGKDAKDGVFLQISEATPDPRTIKCHLPLSLMPPNMLDTCKVIYIARNPKDVCVSYYHHSRIMRPHGYVGDLDQFVKYFVNDELLYSPYGTHLKEAWAKRGHKNFHFVFYEDMKADTKKEIKALNEFIGTNLTDKQIQNVLEYTSFASMKARDNVIGGDGNKAIMNMDIVESAGGFFRKGEAGSWKDKLTPEQEAKIEDWTRRNMEGIPFKYKI